MGHGTPGFGGNCLDCDIKTTWLTRCMVCRQSSSSVTDCMDAAVALGSACLASSSKGHGTVRLLGLICKQHGTTGDGGHCTTAWDAITTKFGKKLL